MSTVVVPTSAALGRPFLFDDEDADPVVGIVSTAPKQQSAADWVLQSAIKNHNSKIPPASITPASRLDIILADQESFPFWSFSHKSTRWERDESW